MCELLLTKGAPSTCGDRIAFSCYVVANLTTYLLFWHAAASKFIKLRKQEMKWLSFLHLRIEWLKTQTFCLKTVNTDKMSTKLQCIRDYHANLDNNLNKQCSPSWSQMFSVLTTLPASYINRWAERGSQKAHCTSSSSSSALHYTFRYSHDLLDQLSSK